MSKEIRNDLEKLKDVQIPDEGEKPVEQNPETPKVPEQKPGFAGRMGMKLCALDEKRGEKKLAKQQALEAKKLAKEEKKANKKPISKGKIIAGAVVGTAVLGAIAKAVVNVAASAQNGNVCGEPEDLMKLTELDDTPVEETGPVETEE